MGVLWWVPSVRIGDAEVVDAAGAAGSRPDDDPRPRLFPSPDVVDRLLEDPTRRWRLEALVDAPTFASPSEIRDRARMLLEAGRLEVRPTGSEYGGAADLPEVPLATLTDPEALKQPHVIAIELLGEDDKPIPGARYRIECPDGRVVQGTLDGFGRAEHRDLETEGACTVTFPDLDAEAWAYVDAAPML